MRWWRKLHRESFILRIPIAMIKSLDQAGILIGLVESVQSF